MTQDYKVEFPRYDDELPTLKGFEDSSWHNDACPSLMKYIDDKGTFVQIFCDYKNKEESDFADLDGDDYYRFTVMLANSEADWAITLTESNYWKTIEEYITTRFNIGGYYL
jgi:hypothetical protein